MNIIFPYILCYSPEVGYILRVFVVSPLFIGRNTVMDIKNSLDFLYTELISPKLADYNDKHGQQVLSVWHCYFLICSLV